MNDLPLETQVLRIMEQTAEVFAPLLIPGWRYELRAERPEGSEDWEAEHVSIVPLKETVIRVSPEAPVERVRKLVVHELVHVALVTWHCLADQALGMHVPRSSADTMREMIGVAKEQAVETIALALCAAEDRWKGRIDAGNTSQ